MQIIDFRCRPNTPEYLVALDHPLTQRVMQKLGSTPPEPASLEEWVASFVGFGVERLVFPGRQTAQTSAHDVTNEYVADTARRFPDHVIGFAGVDPLGGPRALETIRSSVEVLGLKGVAIDPFGSEVQPNDRRLYPIYAECARLGVPVIVTCGPLPFQGPRLSHGDVRSIDDIACDFPELIIVIDHTGWPWVTETIAIAFRHDNVYIDTSLYSHLPGASLFAEAANTILKDRILFASCFPVIPLELAVERVNSLPFGETARKNVFHDNADKLLRRIGCY